MGKSSIKKTLFFKSEILPGFPKQNEVNIKESKSNEEALGVGWKADLLRTNTNSLFRSKAK